MCVCVCIDTFSYRSSYKRLATLIFISADVLTMVTFLALSLSLQLDFISGKADTKFPWLLVWCIAHFVLSAAAFFVIAELDSFNAYLTFAGGISVLYALLLFLGGALFPAYYMHLRAQLDGVLSILELLFCVALVVPWVLLDAALIGVAQHLGAQSGYSWSNYFSIILPCFDILICAVLMMTMIIKYRSLLGHNPEMVQLLPGSAARHNDLN